MNQSIYNKLDIYDKELYKLQTLNNDVLDENVFKHISKSKLINDFYNNQNNVLDVIKKNGRMIFFVKEQTDELCYIAVLNNGFNIKYVKKQTYELCKIAVEDVNLAFQYVDKNLQTIELCIIAIKNKHKVFKDPFNIQFIRDDLKTYDLWKIALETNGLSIKFMNLDYQTYELCLIAVKNCKESIMIHIKSEYHTNELIEIELLKSGFNEIYIKNPKYLIEKKIPEKIIKKEIEKCIICHEIKQYYFQYECGHLACFDCKLDSCYYNCLDKPFKKSLKVYTTSPDSDILYINTKFKE